jgi:hypothetical protein
MVVLDGQLLTLDLVITVWAVKIKIEGTIEVLQVSRAVDG